MHGNCLSVCMATVWAYAWQLRERMHGNCVNACMATAWACAWQLHERMHGNCMNVYMTTAWMCAWQLRIRDVHSNYVHLCMASWQLRGRVLAQAQGLCRRYVAPFHDCATIYGDISLRDMCALHCVSVIATLGCTTTYTACSVNCENWGADKV